MPGSLHLIDPEWAWAPFEGDSKYRWDRRLAAHLFRRAGFAAHSRQLDEAVRATPSQLVNEITASDHEPLRFRSEMERMARTVLANGNPRRLAAWWLYRMMHTPSQLVEKLTLFWHGHFATSAAKVQDSELMYDQHELLRNHALGGFGEMTQAIARDPAMLIYLDSATNRKSHPNENFARELMELFCLGEGRYTEQDIRELARCFTGWEIRRKRFRFNRYQHDFGSKTILGESGEYTGEDGVRIVLRRDSAPQFIVRKLVRYFVMDEPQLDAALIKPLADQFQRDGLQIRPLIRRILSSRLFFSEYSIGRKVRSPIEVAMGLLRALEATTNMTAVEERLFALGHGVFHPPNVKGWDGGRAWINSSTLLGRANLTQSILTSGETRFADDTLLNYIDHQGLSSASELVDWLVELLFAVPPPDAVRAQLIDLLESPYGDRAQRVADLISAMTTIPEFQLG